MMKQNSLRCLAAILAWGVAADAGWAGEPAEPTASANVTNAAVSADVDPETPADAATNGWVLSFSDEFNGRALDTNKWVIEDGPPLLAQSCWSPENLQVRSGNLWLLTRKEGRGGRHWTTAGIRSRTFRQKQGRFEMRMRPCNASGLNNLFRLTSPESTNDAGRFQIGIAEVHIPSEIITTVETGGREIKALPEARRVTEILFRDFHVYGLEWNDDELIWTLDGKEIRRLKETSCTQEALVRIHSTVLSAFLNRLADPKAAGRSHMDVDWVRVYRRK